MRQLPLISALSNHNHQGQTTEYPCQVGASESALCKPVISHHPSLKRHRPEHRLKHNDSMLQIIKCPYSVIYINMWSVSKMTPKQAFGASTSTTTCICELKINIPIQCIKDMTPFFWRYTKILNFKTFQRSFKHSHKPCPSVYGISYWTLGS